MKRWDCSGVTALDSRENYGGEDLSHLMQVASVMRSRDSDALARSNFAVALDRLGGETDTVRVARFGHWACGWYEIILIDPSDGGAIEKGEEIDRRMAEYPVLDEEHFSELEWTEASELWEGSSVRDRLDYLKGTDVSPFAARRAAMPEDPNGALYDRLRG